MGPQANQSRPPRPKGSQRAERIVVRLNFSAYPIQASLGVLGRKWALLVLMNIALSKAQRFNQMLRSTPGMSRRILAMRLNELERNGFISRAAQEPGYTKWQLTQKGADVLPVLLTLIHFGSKWNASTGTSADLPPALGREFEVVYADGARRE
jgi:DNA-binding HxlR family transcriptional regulator